MKKVLTPEEAVRLAKAIADEYVAPDMVDWSGVTEAEQRDVIVLACYIIKQRRSVVPQRRAMRLLRSWLSPAQRAELRSYHHITVEGASGARYRIFPASGTTHYVELHGTRWFTKASFCLHPEDRLPPADIALAHYLMICTDESAFLAKANRHPSRSHLWDGAYLRHMGEVRRSRASAAA